MNFPTIEEQLEYLRAPGAPTAVNAWCYHPVQGFVQESDPGWRGEPSREDLRALREWEWREWDAGLVWEISARKDQEDAWLRLDTGLQIHFHASYTRTEIAGWGAKLHYAKEINLEGLSIGIESAKLAASRAAYDQLFPEGGES